MRISRFLRVRLLGVRLLAASLLIPTATAAARQPPADGPPRAFTAREAAAWRADLRLLVDSLPRLHPNAFRFTPRATFDSLARTLDVRLPTMARHEAVTALIALVASLRDGHTGINPEFDAAVGFRGLPVELHEFRDGLYVRRAAPAHAALVGARVLRVGRLPADEALRRVETLVPGENAMWLRAHRAKYLRLAEPLAALGVTDDPARVTLTLRTGDAERTVTLDAEPEPRPAGHAAFAPRADWVDMRASDAPVPAWQQRPEAPYHFMLLPESRALYVAYRTAVSEPSDPIPQFLTRVLEAIDSLRPERVVLDLRENSGGESFHNRQLVLGLVHRPAIDRRGRLFALIGRRTFSAAQNLVNELARYTNVTFVGEPTGSRPNFFGDHREIVLPASRLRVTVSELWWQTLDPRDARPWVPPHVAAEPTAEDYRQGRDPVLTAALAAADRPPFRETLAAALARGGAAAAGAAFDSARADPANAYAHALLEAEVNAAGYALLRAGRTADAVAMLARNARAYPQSANVHDSLGEAYERSGETARAVESYRRALALDARFGSARDALHRLGVPP